mgnify:CR=1 FL=1
MKLIDNLNKDMLIYGFGGISARAFSFLLLPVYTRYLTTTEYGTFETLTVISGLIGAIFLMGLTDYQSINFNKNNGNKKHRKEVISSILQWRLICGISCIILATVLSPIMNNLFFQGSLSFEYFFLAFSSILFTQIMYQFADIFRLSFKPWSYICLILFQTFVSNLIILVLIIIYGKGIWGFILGSTLSSLLVGIIGCFLLKKYIDIQKFYYKNFSNIIRFGFPLIPVYMAEFIMGFIDRLFIAYYHGQDDVGIFSIGSRFSIILLVFIDGFRKAWWPFSMKKLHSKNAETFFRFSALWYFNLVSIGVMFLTLFSPSLIHLMIHPTFYEGWTVVGPLAWQFAFLGGFIIVAGGIWKTKKTYLQLPCMIFIIIFSVFLNWLLVPSFGILGAAFSTALTYFFWILLTIIIGEYIWKIGFHYIRITIPVILSFIQINWVIFVDQGELKFVGLLLTFIFSLLCFVNAMIKYENKKLLLKF